MRWAVANQPQKIIAIGLVTIAVVTIAGTTVAVVAQKHNEPEVTYRNEAPAK